MIESGPARAAAIAASDEFPYTVGVEEEFLLLDPATGVNLAVGEQVLADLPAEVRAFSRLEFRQSMVEMASPVCVGLDQLGRHLAGLRWAAAVAAERAGARLTAIAATPVAEPRPVAPANPYFQALTREYGAIAGDTAFCGCHVHVGVPDRQLAVEVCTRLRVWLPVVQALTANSPILNGADTGHASWRAVALERWPTLGPTPEFESVAEYDDTVATLVTAGAALDSTMAFWYARLSPKYPTIEVRVGDTCPTVADTVLAAALVRGLVATAVAEARAGLPAPRVRDCVLSAAHWKAAHDGLEGTLLDLRTGQSRPAWDLVCETFDTIRPALARHGDADLVDVLLSELRRHGTGARRQRALVRSSGTVARMLDQLADLTLRPWRGTVDQTPVTQVAIEMPTSRPLRRFG